MKEHIRNLINEYVESYPKKADFKNMWETPLVRFGNAQDEAFLTLKESVGESHQLPKDILDTASIIISYFIPFTLEVAQSNAQTPDDHASQIWADTYIETNEMMLNLNKYLIEKLNGLGYQANFSKQAGILNKEKLMSNWSQRHVAKICGLGSFGLNNLLITEVGSCGRYNTLVTNLDVEPDKPIEKENCLAKNNTSCSKCIDNCFQGALSQYGFNRFKCYEACLDNDALLGADVCGKCAINIPCAFTNPSQNFQ